MKNNKKVLIVSNEIAKVISKVNYLGNSDIKEGEGILIIDENIISMIKNIIEKEGKAKVIELLKGVKDEEKKIVKEFIY